MKVCAHAHWNSYTVNVNQDIVIYTKNTQMHVEYTPKCTNYTNNVYVLSI